MKNPPKAPCVPRFRYTTLCYDAQPRPNRSLDVFVPDQSTRRCSVLFVHGGGWTGGVRSAFHPIMVALTKLGYVCGSLDYRLGGGATALEQVEDVALGRQVFTDYLKESGYPEGIVLCGSSAGAHLALLAGMRDSEEPTLGIVAASGPVTFELWEEIFPPIRDAMVSIAGKSMTDAPELYRELSPYYHINGCTPPICLLNGANEHMFPRPLTEVFVAKMQLAGRFVESHVYANAEHGFFYDVTRSCQQKAFHDVTRFLAKI